MKKTIFLFLLLLSTTLLAQKQSKKDYLVKISTEFGDMYAVLYDETPLHEKNFIHLADSGFYDSLLFHRIINEFMVQGGDPYSKKAEPGMPLGGGDIGYKIPAEIKEGIFHKKGVLAAARDNNPEKASSGCQFYIAHGKKYSPDEMGMLEMRLGKKLTEEQKRAYSTIGGIPHLDGNYTVFGEVIKGLEVIDAIAKQEKDGYDRPVKDIRMKISVKKMKKKKISKLYGYSFPKGI